MESTVQITINLPLSEANKLINYAKENNQTVDDTVARLIERPAAAFNEMHSRIAALECMVGALLHDMFNQDRPPHLIKPIDLANSRIEEMTPEGVLACLHIDDEGEQRFLRHYAQHNDPLITDGTVITGALTGKTIKSVHTVSGKHRKPVGVCLLTEDDHWVDLIAVKKSFDPKLGLTAGLQRDASARMIWHVFKGP